MYAWDDSSCCRQAGFSKRVNLAEERIDVVHGELRRHAHRHGEVGGGEGVEPHAIEPHEPEYLQGHLLTLSLSLSFSYSMSSESLHFLPACGPTPLTLFFYSVINNHIFNQHRD
jgi:hypothetical protein